MAAPNSPIPDENMSDVFLQGHFRGQWYV